MLGNEKEKIQAWRDLTDHAENVWHEKMRFPTDQELRRVLKLRGMNWRENDIQYLLGHKLFDEMLADRGIRRHGAEDLAPEQIVAVTTFLDVSDRRSLPRKLAALGIKSTAWNGWMKDPAFKKYIEKQAQELFASGLPVAHEALMRQVAAGDIRAIKLYYDKFGFGADVQQGNVQDIRLITVRLIEVIQRHVTDPEVLKKIANDFELVVNGGVATQIPNTVKGEISA
jgi:hypothetical protein